MVANFPRPIPATFARHLDSGPWQWQWRNTGVRAASHDLNIVDYFALTPNGKFTMFQIPLHRIIEALLCPTTYLFIAPVVCTADYEVQLVVPSITNHMVLPDDLLPPVGWLSSLSCYTAAAVRIYQFRSSSAS